MNTPDPDGTDQLRASAPVLRRSELSTPGSSMAMMEKAATSGADLVFCDLEDSVAPAEKIAARQRVVQALTTLDWSRTARAVRINEVNGSFGYEDIVTVVQGAGHVLDALVLPKVRAPRDVWFVDTLLQAIEAQLSRPPRIRLEVLIEEAEALARVEEIAGCCDRIDALVFGPGDLAASLGCDTATIGGSDEQAYPGDMWHHARTRILVAARAAGLVAIDGPYADVRDGQGYRREAVRARALGFEGKWAIHPSQIPVANEVFAPTPAAVDHARRVIDAHAQAELRGLGATVVDGAMVDAASVRRQRDVLAIADALPVESVDREPGNRD